MKLIYCLLVLLCPAREAIAQPPPPLKVTALSVGDKVPEIELGNVINYPDTVLTLQGHSNKLTIIDFWATWCNSCIYSFPSVDSLADRYSDQVRFVLVNNQKGTGDNSIKASSFFKKWLAKFGNPFAPPVVVGDSTTALLFPHIFLPHYVVIGENNRVLGFPESTKQLRQIIDAVLNSRIGVGGPGHEN